jgi:trafficking protein particle complex subunit 12
LLENGHFRAAALETANALTADPAPSQDEIFRLLFIRLACLTILGQLAQAGQESRCLQDISSPFYLATGSSRQSILPWELRVLATRLQSISINEPRKAVMGYYDLARDARVAVQAATSEDERSLWRSRLFDLGIRVANALVETGDVIAAARHLETMDTDAVPAAERQLVRGRLGLLYLRIGNLNAARKYIVQGEEDSHTPSADYADILRPLLSVAEGNYSSAATQLDATKNMPGTEISLSTTNLAVALLYAGDLKQSKQMLEELLQKGMRFPTLLFNLATIFELCTEKARTMKVQLAEDVAKQRDTLGYERSLVDFKL